MASMMDCKKIQSQLSEYIDDKLASEDAWNLRLHLASCAVCSQAHQELNATVSLLQTLPLLETSAGFEEALARRLADQVLQPRRESLKDRIQDRLRAWWRTPRIRPTLATAGALAVLIPAAVLFLTNQNAQIKAGAQPVAAAEEQQFVDTVLEEHASYASAVPLSDDSALLLSSSVQSKSAN